MGLTREEALKILGLEDGKYFMNGWETVPLVNCLGVTTVGKLFDSGSGVPPFS